MTTIPAREEDAAATARMEDLPVDRIEPNPRQPRRNFPPGLIDSLAQSIRGQGMLQPLVARPHPSRPGYYQLVAGERRLRAMKKLALKTVPVLVRDIPDDHLLETALVENLQREPLTPIEEAAAYRALLQNHGYSQEALATRLGKDRSTIANMIRLLALPPLLREDLEAGRLTTGHARALLAVPEADRQVGLRNLVVERGLSVRETEALVNRERRAPSAASRGAKQAPDPLAENSERLQFQAVQEMLERRFSTRITIRPAEGAGGKNGGGRIEIEYYSLDDFNRLYDLLTR